MTLSKRNVEGVKFAYIPRSCDYCKRVFWLEPYTMKRKVNPYVGFVFKYESQVDLIIDVREVSRCS